MTVWLMVLWLSFSYAGGPVQVGPFATREACEEAGAIILEKHEAARPRGNNAPGYFACIGGILVKP